MRNTHKQNLVLVGGFAQTTQGSNRRGMLRDSFADVERVTSVRDDQHSTTVRSDADKLVRDRRDPPEIRNCKMPRNQVFIS